MNFYNFNDFPIMWFWSFLDGPNIGLNAYIATETRIMYGSDAGQPTRSLLYMYSPFVIYSMLNAQPNT